MVKSLRKRTRQLMQHRGMQIAVTAGVCLLSAAALTAGFMWYRTSREQQASDAFVKAVYNQLEHARSQNTDQAWYEAMEAFGYGYEQYAYAGIAPYFLVYKAEALHKQGEHEQACHTLAQALDYFSRDNTLYYAYSIQLALMQIDAQDRQLRETGEKSLEALANDTQNPLQEMAQYYHGLLYFNRQDREAAYQAWHALIQKGDTSDSAWASHAQAKLAYRE